MYPYGFFYEKGTCQDAEDEYAGRSTKTARMKDCTTPSGIWDMAGNLQEWVGSSEKDAALVGGDWRGGKDPGAIAAPRPSARVNETTPSDSDAAQTPWWIAGK